MSNSLEMTTPHEDNRLDDMVQGVLGTALDRPEGPLKVSGTATYAHEWKLDGMAHGVLVLSSRPAGRVTSIDRASVEALPGVLRVLTDDRFLKRTAQGMEGEAPPQGIDEIGHTGQPLALIVAETFEAARDAAIQLDLKIEEASADLDPETAPSEEEERDAQGDLDGAMTAAAHSVDVTYTTPGHNSAAMEPHASIASWDGDALTLRGSYQMLKFNKAELADALGIDAENVRVLSPYVGGGFGSKLGIATEAIAAAIAAQELGRPVAVAMTRPQVFDLALRRTETRQRIRLAADADGRLDGIGHEAWISNTRDGGFSEPVTQATPFIYRGDHRLTAMTKAFVNLPPAGSVRAPGESVGHTVLENAMDELAHEIGMDPVELRRRNIPERDPMQDIPFSSHKLREALDHGAEAFGWSDRKAEPGARREGEWLIGMGMATAVRVHMLLESEARVRLAPDGAVTVETDMTDIGTGTYAILTQIAAEMLGRPAAAVTTILGDTDLPPSSGSGGSFGAASSGTSVYLACMALRRELARRMGCDEGELTLKDGDAIAANRKVSLADLLGGDTLEERGHCEGSATSEKARQATFGAYFAEVAVNAVTGEPRVRRMQGTFAAGRILNPKTARSQCLGGMTWGIGMALTEELMHDPRTGAIVNGNLAEYHLPVHLDVPQIDVHLLEERDPWASPMQVKGIGELGICGAAASITNAIFNATGVRVRDYPATLDRIFPHL
ncbi:xanthine dehydrogenase family protein molybdopterin-binding subunit [Roseobacter sp. HKCCA0434]|uniref:xanthine dehydrogenase family protein molybdopterin-binding subunit n=1 Tax=Roseobacter sp. HKCCA0434 TaxID=3079297 RepID=UPI002905DD53|nr:xanthine dehydrogenase family protein molybdopterin-binding subunit [Roseobacter sp. HKCCA0434]